MELKLLANAVVIGGSWYTFHKTNSKTAHWAVLVLTLSILATIAN